MKSIKTTPIIKNDDIFVIKVKDKLPRGIKVPDRGFLGGRKSKSTLDSDTLSFGTFTDYKQMSEKRKSKALQLKAIIPKSEIEYLDICDYLRDINYEEHAAFLDYGNGWKEAVKMILKLSRKGIESKLIYYGNWYGVWAKIA